MLWLNEITIIRIHANNDKFFYKQLSGSILEPMTRKNSLILSIDQGTTSSRAIVFDLNGVIRSSAQKEIEQIYPKNGWVEHNPEEIWETTIQVCHEALAKCNSSVSGIGITNQREKIVLWDRKTGIPVANAIVWQDRRTAPICAQLRAENIEELVNDKTGLLLDPYFSATKLCWLLDNVEGARRRAENGELAAGTIDSFLLWRLTGGELHATDATNASRTSLFNIHTQKWDADLMAIFRVPDLILPDVKDSSDDYGHSIPNLLGTAIPILGVAGDQNAALVGQACVNPGMVKSTYGTGGFVLVNTGKKILRSKHRLLTTLSYRIRGNVHYAIEGSIFNTGTSIQWMRDNLQFIKDADETEIYARHSVNNQIMFVPSFTGLGAPHWNPNARGAIYGLTRDTTPADMIRAALESVGYQSADLITAMRIDIAGAINTLRVDGGMSKNDWMLQFLADVTGVTVERSRVMETTGLGVAFLASLQTGIISSLEDLHKLWRSDKIFKSNISQNRRQALLENWALAVKSTQAFSVE